MSASSLGWKRAGFGLGVFSVALGAAELVAGRRIARALDAGDHVGLVHGFGLRELVAGIGLLQAPANSSGAWGRVSGDVMDLAALAAAARRAPGNRAVWSALAFVGCALIVDVVVARGLDRTTGRTLPAVG